MRDTLANDTGDMSTCWHVGTQSFCESNRLCWWKPQCSRFVNLLTNRLRHLMSKFIPLSVCWVIKSLTVLFCRRAVVLPISAVRSEQAMCSSSTPSFWILLQWGMAPSFSFSVFPPFFKIMKSKLHLKTKESLWSSNWFLSLYPNEMQ